MGQFEDDVRELIREDHRSIASFARKIGIPEHTLYSALSNGLANTTFSTLVPIVKGLGITFEEVIEGTLRRHPGPNLAVDVPLYGTISAGRPLEPSLADGTFPVPASLHARHPHAFMLRVEGNSMNRRFADGSYVLVDPALPLDVSGRIYAVMVGDADATVKRVLLHDHGLTLQPESNDPTYQPMLFIHGDPTAQTVRSIGRVVWSCGPQD